MMYICKRLWVLKGEALRTHRLAQGDGGGGEQRSANQGETSPFFIMANKGIDIAKPFIYIKNVIRKSS